VVFLLWWPPEPWAELAEAPRSTRTASAAMNLIRFAFIVRLQSRALEARRRSGGALAIES
jgi:hypothetical protein